MITDISMSLISAILAITILNKVAGVREGTVIAAFLVGTIIKFLKKIFHPVEGKLLSRNNS